MRGFWRRALVRSSTLHNGKVVYHVSGEHPSFLRDGFYEEVIKLEAEHVEEQAAKARRIGGGRQKKK
jgi:hypothetical protein